MASLGQSSPAQAKKLLDSMQNDLRTLSAECKRKHPEVKEVGIVRFIWEYLPDIWCFTFKIIKEI